MTTKGPWKYESGCVWGGPYNAVLLRAERGVSPVPPAERDANARAASAVPELLDACRLLVEAYQQGEENGGSMDWNDVDRAWEAAKAALAKVEGRGQ